MRFGFDYIAEQPLWGSWRRRIRNWLNAFVSKSMGFSQENMGFLRVVIENIQGIKIKLIIADTL